MFEKRKTDKAVVVVGVVLVVVGAMSFAWVLPVRSEEIYGDYTHWGPHPCSHICSEYEAQEPLVYGCCIYYEEAYPLKFGHVDYNVFGVEIGREWDYAM